MRIPLDDVNVMDAKIFLQTATDPKQWLSRSRSLRFAGDQLWDLIVKEMRKQEKKEKEGKSEHDTDNT